MSIFDTVSDGYIHNYLKRLLKYSYLFNHLFVGLDFFHVLQLKLEQMNAELDMRIQFLSQIYFTFVKLENIAILFTNFVLFWKI